jgi:hemerythrin-like domain-containing protein
MKPAEDLKVEHALTMKMLAVLQAICSKMEKHEIGLAKDIEEIVAFLRVFVDRCHHGKEEDILFPGLEALGVFDESDLIEKLRMEHRTGRALVEQMGRFIEISKEGAAVPPSDFVDPAKRYVELIRKHIRTENGTLLPGVREKLSEERQLEISQEFERLEREKIGEGKHESFVNLVQRLTQAHVN